MWPASVDENTDWVTMLSPEIYYMGAKTYPSMLSMQSLETAFLTMTKKIYHKQDSFNLGQHASYLGESSAHTNW